MRDDVAHVWQGRDDVVHTPHGMHAPPEGHTALGTRSNGGQDSATATEEAYKSNLTKGAGPSVTTEKRY